MNWKILCKYRRGTCSREEVEKLGAWLQGNPANEDFFTTYIEGGDVEELLDLETDARQAWQTFKRRGPLSSDAAPSKRLAGSKYRNPVARQKSSRYWYSFAAAVIMIATLSVVVWQITTRGGPAGEEKIAVKEVSASKGQRTSLRLSDGTFVMLNADSKLEIPKNYGSNSRTVHLQGEAFFEVSHDNAHPFLVITPQGFVKDLGTQFNVTAYDSGRLEVAVKEGRASLGRVRQGTPRKELAELSPNKLGVLKKESGLTVSDISDIEAFTGWTSGKLVFQQTPLPEVIQRLERRFAVEGVIEDSVLTKRTLTATYDRMPLSEILKVLAISLDLTYTRQKNNIEFQARR